MPYGASASPAPPLHPPLLPRLTFAPAIWFRNLCSLGVDPRTLEEVESLLTQLQQLLVGISIMQARGHSHIGAGLVLMHGPVVSLVEG